MKKVWLMFVLSSLMVVGGCSGKAITEDMQAVSVDSVVEGVRVSEVVVEDSGGNYGMDAMEEVHSQEPVSDEYRFSVIFNTNFIKKRLQKLIFDNKIKLGKYV